MNPDNRGKDIINREIKPGKTNPPQQLYKILLSPNKGG